MGIVVDVAGKFVGILRERAPMTAVAGEQAIGFSVRDKLTYRTRLCNG